MPSTPATATATAAMSGVPPRRFEGLLGEPVLTIGCTYAFPAIGKPTLAGAAGSAKNRPADRDRMEQIYPGAHLRAGRTGKVRDVTSEIPESPLQPSLGERAIDTATDVSRTVTDVSDGLRAAIDRLSDTIRTSRQPGGTLSTISAITREAPLASLFVAFLFGIAVARRR